MIRRRMMQVALALLPALSLSTAALGDPPPHAPPGTPMETLHMVMQDIPGAEYEKANQLKNEAMHALLMNGGDLEAIEPKLKAFAAEYARVAGSDPKAMEAHVMEVGAQIASLARDPDFLAHLSQLHGDH